MSEAAAPARPAGAAASRRGWPLFVQVFALVMLSLIAAQAVNLVILYTLPPPPPEFYRLSEVVRALQAGGSEVTARNGRVLKAEVSQTLPRLNNTRPSIMAGERQTELRERLGAEPENVRLTFLDATQTPGRRNVRQLRDQLGPSPANRSADPFLVAPFEADLRRADGRWLVLRATSGGLFRLWWQRTLLWFGLSVLVVIPAAYLFARRLAAPITAFSAAAERLGRDPGAELLAPAGPGGPAELTAAIAAFNEMQERLRRYVHDRTDMIAAIAHDLRTPLTRLRFRVEQAPDALAVKMQYDIDQMEAMIAATMAFVRDATHQGAREKLELASLVDTIANEMADTGRDVMADTEPPVVVYGDPMALRRLVTNLLDNAVKFGARARARVYVEGQTAVVVVDDDGPGVPPDQQERVFEPFHRGERSRSRQTGGAGLGLAVVRTIARAHGGDAALENRPGGGLRAMARLPLAAAA